MPNWRDELIDAVKTRAEREAEEAARHRKRVEEALASAEEALNLGAGALRFARERLSEKGLPVSFEEQANAFHLGLQGQSLGLSLDRETATIKVVFGEGKPREFDFAKDRHIAAGDVEEYVGRRAVEMIRAAHRAQPW